MQTKNSALWDAIGEYAETHHEFMSAPTQALDKAIRAGESLYIAHEAARANLEALIGKRNENDAAPAVKHEASELPPLPRCKLLSGVNLESLHVLYSADQMRAYGQACITAAAPPIAVQGSIGEDAEFKRLLHRVMTEDGERKGGAYISLAAYIDSRSPVAAAPVAAAPAGYGDVLEGGA